jgi:putative glucoamylase/uncharacterized protein DUF3131
MHRRPSRSLVVAAVLAALVLPAGASGAGAASYSDAQRATLQAYARDAWGAFVAMTDANTGLTADNVEADGTRARYTSPTNIASYIWSALTARDLGIITAADAEGRIAQTLGALAKLERAHGQYYNWYDPATGARLHQWPADGSRVYGFLSTVDNGWLAAGLMMVANTVPASRDAANKLLRDMDFSFYYNPAEGQLRGGAWTEQPPDCSIPDKRDGKAVWFTCHHYGTLNTEPRIASYIGIARGQLPETHYFRLFRTFPPTCDWNWQEMQPVGVHRTYLGVDVFEGTYEYRGMRMVPSWGGSMFEALMVPLLVPEETWAPRSWGVNHPLHVESQIQHGLKEAKYGYWGFSPSSDPAGGYREYGVDPIGMNPDGYSSDEERTTTDYGFDDCRPAQKQKPFGQGVVTPHASFLALEFAPGASLANLEKLRSNFDAYGKYGFYDAINVSSGAVARRYLALDEGMIVAAVGNALTGDRLQSYFTAGDVTRVIKPLIAQEVFESGTGR